ncbi:DUF3027 domain-containing protein [Nocardia sp. NBC_01503]|uniref:DUF3027 domain-containing protein n=1 Tax=Nocardia sp. NBC_01503 TaxID=2975997 RepID=UPI002E7C3C3A|nr:DUF3027 domain-containing protein [Nocardia sp. NBC_01503]WTL34136.1 DUF3027 domain-containing protein [Nocardia sp. NBC_01503]
MSAVGVSESGVRPILAEAVDLARRALLELEPLGVGRHIGVTAEDDSAATHHFEATLPGYRGWQWAVVVAAPPEATHVTVSESALLPGPDALIAPDFLPWDQRIRPGDLAPGDLLAPPAGDPRLVPGYIASGDPVVDDVALELGLGRPQVLSREGREEAADRWFSEFGPETDMARAAPGTCGACGFFVPLAGGLRAAFGVCANAMGADGRVVHMEYGCGAHSDTELPTGAGSPIYEAFDDAAFDVIPAEELRKPEPAPETPAATVEVATETPAAEADDSAAGVVVAAATPAVQAETVVADVIAVVDNTGEAVTVVESVSDAGSAVTVEAADVASESIVVEGVPDAVASESAPVEPAAPDAPADNGIPALFDIADPDAVVDDAWGVSAVRVETETGAADTDDSGAAE